MRKYGKWIFYEDRWIPIFRGGSTDDQNEDPDNTTNNNTNNSSEATNTNVEKLKKEAIQNFIKQFGLESPEQIKEVIEKAKQAEEKTTTLQQLQNELQNFKKAYEMEKVSNAVLSEANKVGAIDPEIIMLMAKEKAEIKDGKVVIEGKTVEEFLNQLKKRKPHLFKAVEGEGSGTTAAQKISEKTENLSKEERLKIAFRKKFGG